jgi:hypothetical protein
MTHGNHVLFRFLSAVARENVDLNGTVIEQDGQMILDIQDDNAASPYRIIGVMRDHYFEGVNSADMGDAVAACWADCGGMYVGRWVEDSVEFLFTFAIPRKPKT